MHESTFESSLSQLAKNKKSKKKCRGNHMSEQVPFLVSPCSLAIARSSSLPLPITWDMSYSNSMIEWLRLYLQTKAYGRTTCVSNMPYRKREAWGVHKYFFIMFNTLWFAFRPNMFCNFIPVPQSIHFKTLQKKYSLSQHRSKNRSQVHKPFWGLEDESHHKKNKIF